MTFVPWRLRGPLFFLVIALVVGGFWFIDFAIAVVRYPFYLDYTEGTLYCHITEWIKGEPLYGSVDSPPFFFNIYPPGYYLLTTTLVQFTQADPLIIGRILASGSSLLIAGVMVALVWHTLAYIDRGIRLACAIISGLLFLLVRGTFLDATVMRVDTPALAASLLGLYIFCRYAGRSSIVYVCAPLFTLSIFIKHSMLAAPAACCLVGIFYARTVTVKLILFLILGTFMLFALSGLYFGKELFSHIVNSNALGLVLSDSLNGLKQFVKAHYAISIFTAMAVILLAWEGRRSRALPSFTYAMLATYCALAFLVMLIAKGRPGVAENWFIEPTVSIAMLASASLGKSISFVTHYSNHDHRKYILWNSIAMVGIGLFAWQYYLHASYWPSSNLPRTKNYKDVKKLLRHIRKVDGFIIAEYTLPVCRAGNRAFANQFMAAQLAYRGSWPQEHYIRAVDRKVPQLAIMRFDLEKTKRTPRFTPEMLAAINENYVLQARQGNFWIYSPRKD